MIDILKKGNRIKVALNDEFENDIILFSTINYRMYYFVCFMYFNIYIYHVEMSTYVRLFIRVMGD